MSKPMYYIELEETFVPTVAVCYWWRVKNRNTQIILTSETYTTKRARNDSAKRYAKFTGMSIL